MSAPLTHDDLRSLLGVHALDAVEPEEAWAVDAHLETCATCRAESAEHRETVALLAEGADPLPDDVWERVAAALWSSEGAPSEPVTPRRRASSSSGRALAPRRSGMSVRVLGVAAAVAVALAAVGVLWRATGAGTDASGEVAAAAAEPTTRFVTLTSADGTYAARAVVRADGRAWLLERRVPDLAPGRTWQLWSIDAGARSAAVLDDRPGTTSFTLDGGAATLAVTVEPAGGSRAPTSAPVATGTIATS